MKTTQRHTIATLYRKIVSAHSNLFAYDERKELKNIFIKFSDQVSPKEQNIEKHISTKIKITEILLSEIGLGKAAVLSILLHEMVEKKLLSVEEIEKTFNTQISSIMQGMIRVQELYARNSSLETENFRKLFLTFAQDIRVILIIIAEHLQTMRELDTS